MLGSSPLRIILLTLGNELFIGRVVQRQDLGTPFPITFSSTSCFSSVSAKVYCGTFDVRSGGVSWAAACCWKPISARKIAAIAALDTTRAFLLLIALSLLILGVSLLFPL